MIAVRKIDQELQVKMGELSAIRMSPEAKGESRVKGRIEFLKTCQRYLEGNPSEEYLTQERDRLEAKLDKIEKGFKSWLDCSGLSIDEKDAKAIYRREMNVSKHRRHLKTINFLLD